MASSNPPIFPAAKPKYNNHFDAWSSSSTGHQTAENKLSSSVRWRHSRSLKLSHQFKSRVTGRQRISNRVGAGFEGWNEKASYLLPKDETAQSINSVSDMLASKSSPTSSRNKVSKESKSDPPDNTANKLVEPRPSSKRHIFDGLTIYVNGCVQPLISDHQLKHLLARNGAKISIHLNRRKVTHVILGNPCGKSSAMGVGGGLAGDKIQKEVMRIGGCGIRYVNVQWVLESLEAGIRLPESRFVNLALVSKRQPSVYQNILRAGGNLSESPRRKFTGETSNTN